MRYFANIGIIGILGIFMIVIPFVVVPDFIWVGGEKRAENRENSLDGVDGGLDLIRHAIRHEERYRNPPSPRIPQELQRAPVRPSPRPEEGSVEDKVCSLDWDCPTMLHIMYRESGGDPQIENFEGSGAIGLFQIHPIHAPWVLDEFGYTWFELKDADKNIQVAYRLWQLWGLSPWGYSYD